MAKLVNDLLTNILLLPCWKKKKVENSFGVWLDKNSNFFCQAAIKFVKRLKRSSLFFFLYRAVHPIHLTATIQSQKKETYNE